MTEALVPHSHNSSSLFSKLRRRSTSTPQLPPQELGKDKSIDPPGSRPAWSRAMQSAGERISGGRSEATRRSDSVVQSDRPAPPSAFTPHRKQMLALQHQSEGQQQQHQQQPSAFGNAPTISRRRSSLERGVLGKQVVPFPAGTSQTIKASDSLNANTSLSALPSMTFSHSQSSIHSVQVDGNDDDDDGDDSGFYTPSAGQSPERVHAKSSSDNGSGDLFSPETALSFLPLDVGPAAELAPSPSPDRSVPGMSGLYQRVYDTASVSNLGKQIGWQSKETFAAGRFEKTAAADQGDQLTFLPNFDDDEDDGDKAMVTGENRLPHEKTFGSPINVSKFTSRPHRVPAPRVNAIDYAHHRSGKEWTILGASGEADLQHVEKYELYQDEGPKKGKIIVKNQTQSRDESLDQSRSHHMPNQRPSFNTLRGLYSNLRSKKGEDGEDRSRPDESLWEKERRLEAKRQAEETKKKRGEEKAKALMAEFSLEKKREPAARSEKSKGKAKEIGAGSLSSGSGSSRSASMVSSDSTRRRDRERDHSHTSPPPGRTRSKTELAAFSNSDDAYHRQARREKSGTIAVTADDYSNPNRVDSSATAGDSFIRIGSDTSSNTAHSRQASDVSSAASRSIRWDDANSSFLPIALHAIQTSRKQVRGSGRPVDTSELQSSGRERLPSIMMQRSVLPSQAERETPGKADNVLGLSDSTTRGPSTEVRSSPQDMLEGEEPQFRHLSAPHPFASDTYATGLDRLGSLGEVPIRSSPIQVQLLSLPSLTTMVDDCLAALHYSEIDPWQSVKTRPLTVSSSREAVPKSWASYIKAYSRGEMDLSTPPTPRSSPLVKQARPRASPNPNASRIPIAPSSPAFRSLAHRSSCNSISSAYELAIGTSKGIGPENGARRSQDREYGSRISLRSPSCDALVSYSPSTSSSWLPSPTPVTPSKTSSPRFASSSPKSPRFGLRKTRSKEILRMPQDNAGEIRLQAEEISAVGGMGDIRAPRPAWEGERSQAAKALSKVCCREKFQRSDEDYSVVAAVSRLKPNAKLEAIVERLIVSLDCSYAGVQLLLSDEVLVLASSGLDERARASLDGFTTPRVETFGEVEQTLRSKDSILKGRKLWRDRTLDAHTILSRNAAPLVVEDLSVDWRFDAREAADVRFYAGAAILSASGLPVGTVSITDAKPRRNTFSKAARETIAEAAREASEELQTLQRQNMISTLAHLDETLMSWAGLKCNERESTMTSPSAASQSSEYFGANGIEATLEGSNKIDAALRAAPSLALRRGARIPTTLNVPTSPAVDFGFERDEELTTTSLSVLDARLSSALTTIIQSLPEIDLAYVARVCSHPLDCHVITSRQSDIYGSGCNNELDLDAEMHLCALAASKVGLRFDREADKVAQLIGSDFGKQPDSFGQASVAVRGILDDSASESNFEDDEEAHHRHVLGPAVANDASVGRPLQSAIVVGCGLKEGGRAHRGTEGWLLSVASRSSDPLGPEVNLFLLRFAALLASLLLEGPRSPATPKRSLTPITARTPCLTRSTTPAVVRNSRIGKHTYGGPASPPPNAPLPLPPISPSKTHAPLPALPSSLLRVRASSPPSAATEKLLLSSSSSSSSSPSPSPSSPQQLARSSVVNIGSNQPSHLRPQSTTCDSNPSSSGNSMSN